MSDATAIAGIGAREAARKAPPWQGWADHALVQLTLVRFREFCANPKRFFGYSCFQSYWRRVWDWHSATGRPKF